MTFILMLRSIKRILEVKYLQGVREWRQLEELPRFVMKVLFDYDIINNRL